MAIEIVTAPAEEPLSLQEAKDHLRVEVAADDSLIGRLITDAREWVERYTRRALVTQTWRLWARQFPDGCRDQDGVADHRWIGHANRDLGLHLPGGKVQSVSNVKYIDAAGTLQTLAGTEYTLHAKDPQCIARLTPAYGKSWPGTRDEPNAVQVEYVVGYGVAAAVPAIAKQSILLHVGWHYENREPATFGATGAMSQILGALELKLADLRLFTFA
ncbi:MAG: head-tail connector protein [Phycisphaerales bacterium]